MHTEEKLSEVNAFWDTEACGTHFVRESADLADFYQEGFRFAMDLARTLSARLIVPGASL